MKRQFCQVLRLLVIEVLNNHATFGRAKPCFNHDQINIPAWSPVIFSNKDCRKSLYWNSPSQGRGECTGDY